MKIGYIRVSTKEQNTDRQDILLNQLGAEKIFIDELSGKDTNRPQLQEMLTFVREGDTVIIESYSRLARSTKDLLNIVETLKAKGVTLISNKENINTGTPSGQLMLTIFAGLAQFEREIMLQRQSEGILAAKARGVHAGRPKTTVDNFGKYYQKWQNKEMTAVAIQKELQLKPRTFYRMIAEYSAN